MLTNIIKYGVALHSIKHTTAKNRNLIIHHGLMGSSKNFRTISKSTPVSSYCDTYLIDARNHGESPHTDTHTVSDLADDLLEYIRANNLGRRLTLMGHSMGGLALMEFTKRHSSSQIQSFVDRVIIIDIPSNPVINYPSFKATGDMLKRFESINLSQSLTQIHEEIDKYAISKDIAALIKTNLGKQNDGAYRWLVNLKLLAYEGYDNIGKYDLGLNNNREWRKPVQYIYGQKSNYYDENQYQRYCDFYPQMSRQNFHGIKNAGHWVHADNTRDFLSALSLILQRDGK